MDYDKMYFPKTEVSFLYILLSLIDFYNLKNRTWDLNLNVIYLFLHLQYIYTENVSPSLQKRSRIILIFENLSRTKFF